MTRTEPFEALREARPQIPATGRAFFDAFTAGAELDGLRAADTAFAAATANAEVEALGRGATRVRLVDGANASLLAAINEDGPFLFDSALAATPCRMIRRWRRCWRRTRMARSARWRRCMTMLERRRTSGEPSVAKLKLVSSQIQNLT